MKENNVILAIDFGTTNLKAALINKKGTFFNYQTKKVLPFIDGDICQINAEVYLNFISNYLLSIDTSKVEAIIISSNGPSYIPLYSNIKLKNTTFSFEANETRLWMDKRGAPYSKMVSDYYNKYIDGSFFLPSILSIKNNDIETYNKTKYFISIDGFINLALTGKAYMVNNADGLLNYYWDDNCLDHFNLEESKFPPFIKCGKTIGLINKDVANSFSLNERVKVIAGGSDFYFSVIGSKVNKENILADIVGTSEGLNLCTKKPLKDNRFLCYEHPLPNLYNLSGVLSNSGIALSWVRKVLNIEDLEFNHLFKLAEKSKPNSLIFLPYLSGERAPIWNPNATATMFNLTINSSAEDIANAVIEGTILAFNSVIMLFEKLGFSVDVIHTTSNKNKDDEDYYYQLKSDITDKKFIVFKTPSAELLGLSMLAHTSMGVFSSLKQAIEETNIESKTYIPNKKRSPYYKEKFKLFNSLYNATNSLMSRE